MVIHVGGGQHRAQGATVAVNQQLVPGTFTDQGVGWSTLGTFSVSGGTLTVSLSNNANGYVIADAIRIRKATPQNA